MKRYIWLFAALTALIFVAVSCSDEMTGMPDDTDIVKDEGTLRTVKLRLEVAQGFEGEDPATRSVTTGSVNENEIKDFWFIEYSQENRRVGFPHYYTLESQEELQELQVIIPNYRNNKFHGLIIANTHNPHLFDGQAMLDSTNYLKSLRNELVKKIEKQDDCITSEGYLPMSGSFDIYDDGSGMENVSCQLRRDVAKVVVKLSVPSAEVQLANALWRNVPDNMSLLEHLNHADYNTTKTDNAAYRNLYSSYETFRTKGMGDAASNAPEVTVLNWAEENNVDIKQVGAEPVTMVYYLPRNVCGIYGNTTDEKDKNRAAIQNSLKATFFEINANVTGYQLRYRIYPGKDKYTDFNLLPNYCYNLEIKIEAPGNPGSDSRVTNMNKLRLDESNSYIIKPGGEITYAIPTSRINYFWQEEDPNNVIADDEEWIAEVIWQDQPERMITFYDADNDPMVGATAYTGKGNNAIYFKPSAGVEGNVVVGVRKKSTQTPAPDQREYLWSWHLWITDYNPDENISPWVAGIYDYDVDFGLVHRYESNFWQKSFLNKYIMDRNLGAASPTPSTDIEERKRTYGLYYQFGRFAPFPHADAAIYDIDGQIIPEFAYRSISGIGTTNMTAKKTASSLTEAVKKPYMFFTCQNANNSQGWYAEKQNKYETNVWDNPTWHSSNTKSLFDPCPPGWCIPDVSVWESFRTYTVVAGSGGNTAFQTQADKTAFPFDTYKGYAFYLNPDDPSKGTSWYPAASYKNGSNGGMENTERIPETSTVRGKETTGAYWMSMPASSNFGHQMEFTSTGIQMSANFVRGGRSEGASVRCIRQ